MDFTVTYRLTPELVRRDTRSDLTRYARNTFSIAGLVMLVFVAFASLAGLGAFGESALRNAGVWLAAFVVFFAMTVRNAYASDRRLFARHAAFTMQFRFTDTAIMFQSEVGNAVHPWSWVTGIVQRKHCIMLYTLDGAYAIDRAAITSEQVMEIRIRLHDIAQGRVTPVWSPQVPGAGGLPGTGDAVGSVD